MILKFSEASRCRIRDFARMIDSLVSVCPAVQYGPLYIKAFERTKFLALNNADGNYSSSMEIPAELSSDFQWWIRTFSNPDQENIIRSDLAVREIFSDASLSGWGAACGKNRTRGWWSEADKSDHINLLELKAVFFALQCFASELRDCEVLVRVDNTTAIACVNRFGSVHHPHLMALSKEIWRWCETRNIS